MDLYDQANQVTDRQSFVAFVKALIADREDENAKEEINPSSPYGPGANGWENGSIEAFLEAAIAWSEDSTHDPSVMPEEPSWNLFAQILHAGKFYE